jgi:hypothetical protein
LHPSQLRQSTILEQSPTRSPDESFSDPFASAGRIHIQVSGNDVNEEGEAARNERTPLIPDPNDQEAFYNKFLLRPGFRRSYGSIDSYYTDGGWGERSNEDRESYVERPELEDPLSGGLLEDQGTTVTLPRWFGRGKGKRTKRRM